MVAIVFFKWLNSDLRRNCDLFRASRHLNSIGNNEPNITNKTKYNNESNNCILPRGSSNSSNPAKYTTVTQMQCVSKQNETTQKEISDKSLEISLNPPPPIRFWEFELENNVGGSALTQTEILNANGKDVELSLINRNYVGDNVYISFLRLKCVNVSAFINCICFAYNLLLLLTSLALTTFIQHYFSTYNVLIRQSIVLSSSYACVVAGANFFWEKAAGCTVSELCGEKVHSLALKRI